MLPLYKLISLYVKDCVSRNVYQLPEIVPPSILYFNNWYQQLSQVLSRTYFVYKNVEVMVNFDTNKKINPGSCFIFTKRLFLKGRFLAESWVDIPSFTKLFIFNINGTKLHVRCKLCQNKFQLFGTLGTQISNILYFYRFFYNKIREGNISWERTCRWAYGLF